MFCRPRVAASQLHRSYPLSSSCVVLWNQTGRFWPLMAIADFRLPYCKVSRKRHDKERALAGQITNLQSNPRLRHSSMPNSFASRGREPVQPVQPAQPHHYLGITFTSKTPAMHEGDFTVFNFCIFQGRKKMGKRLKTVHRGYLLIRKLVHVWRRIENPLLQCGNLQFHAISHSRTLCRRKPSRH